MWRVREQGVEVEGAEHDYPENVQCAFVYFPVRCGSSGILTRQTLPFFLNCAMKCPFPLLFSLKGRLADAYLYLKGGILRWIQARSLQTDSEPRDFIEGYLKAVKKNHDLQDRSIQLVQDLFQV